MILYFTGTCNSRYVANTKGNSLKSSLNSHLKLNSIKRNIILSGKPPVKNIILAFFILFFAFSFVSLK